MSTIALGAAGAMIGAGLCVAAYAIRRPTLVERLTPRPASPLTPAPTGTWAQRLRDWVTALLGRVGLPGTSMVRTLTAAGTTVEEYRAEKAAATGLGLLLGVVLLTASTLMPSPGITWIVAASVTLGCFLAPDLAAHRKAVLTRSDLKTAASTLADLTVMGLAAGAGSTGALAQALHYGHGPAAHRLRTAARVATLRHRPPWEGLDTVAEETGVHELAELAASLGLAGTTGARARHSLTAKAVSLRTRRSAEAEAQAHAATERMTLPTMGLVTGFLLLICFAALAHVTTGF